MILLFLNDNSKGKFLTVHHNSLQLSGQKFSQSSVKNLRSPYAQLVSIKLIRNIHSEKHQDLERRKREDYLTPRVRTDGRVTGQVKFTVTQVLSPGLRQKARRRLSRLTLFSSTGRLLVRQLLLPFLLGFKFNLASLLPLLFGALIVITKKALILTKVALLIAGFLGWNSLVSGNPSSGLFGNG